jgi:transcriptional regulator with XRE-family HTH domain
MNCAKALKAVRQRCLLSQQDFANAVGVSFSTVNRWENGKTSPNYRDLKKISDYCKDQGIPFEVQAEILEDKE